MSMVCERCGQPCNFIHVTGTYGSICTECAIALEGSNVERRKKYNKRVKMYKTYGCSEAIEERSMDTLVVNLFGGPCAGKTTVASGLFCLLKMHGVECELITEFAKDLVWEERHKALENQQYIFGKQYHKVWRLLNKVDVVITDSPLMLSVIYIPEDYSDNFIKNVVDTTNSVCNLNILLHRGDKYNENGRYQNKKEAEEVDYNIKKMLLTYKMDCVELDSDFNGINELTKLILGKVNGEAYLNFSIEGE